MNYLLAVVLGYILGSFPTGYLVGRAMGHVDVRTIGSGRTGGTNVLRSVGRGAAALTVLGDLAKGTIAVLIVRTVTGGDPLAEALAALFSVIGHNYSFLLGFKGGAGTMTALGAFLGLNPLVMLLSGLIPLLFTYITRMTSVGSLLFSSISLLVAGILAWQGYFPSSYLVFFLSFFLLSWYSHRPNLERLRAGTERRIGEKAQVVAQEGG
jgi:acyl phosphate:glycerol-3-phosphate acyltransferase